MKKNPEEKPLDPAVAAQLSAIKARGCFRCDGSGQICNICGESERACECDEEDFSDCEDCKGKGK